ncbi:methionine--tRNA ligase [Candidatus Woesearchaeota archaeon]|nr:methionine--tRNA ligase [Candidatus Woesearchaeota archaeon]
MKKERRLVTAALPYTNNVPHIGNIVGSHLPADIFARYCRLMGYDTVFIGGTDEHGTATEITAQKYGVTPKRVCDFFYSIHKQIYEWFEISYDNFSRTSNPTHHKFSQEFFKKVYENKFMVEKELDLPYCKVCAKYLSDRFIEGVCPSCGYEKAKGDQCESCSRILDPIKLKNPSCAVCGSEKIEFKKVKHLFLDLEKLSPKLEAWIKKQDMWRQQVSGLAMGWIKEGLKPRCITRDLQWGVKVPIKGFEDKVIYCWFDAPLGYISFTQEWDPKRWSEFWQKKDSKIYHFIGKDNIPFHTIFFPGMLLANGEFNLPYNVVGLQYLNYERTKFSKSKGVGVFCENLPTAGLDADYWRFYLTFTIPETKDTEFLWKDFQERVNAELVGNFGNFFNRTLTFIWNKFGGAIPKPKKEDKVFAKNVEEQTAAIISDFERAELRSALEGILRLSDLGNKYFQEKEPWKNLDETTIFLCANLCKTLALLIQPFLPASSKKLLNMLNSEEGDWKKLTKQTLIGGHKIKKPEIIFHKLEEEQVKELAKKTSKITQYFKEVAEVEPEGKKLKALDKISFDDWKKLDLRVGVIKKIEVHPKADKLYVMLVDLGKGETDRQVVAGIKPYYKMEELEGKKVILFTNLEPVLVRGIESNGMILAAVKNGQVTVLTVDRDIEEGARIE